MNDARRSKRILLIDDDGFIRELLTRHLQRGGHKVVQAANGMEGLEQLERGQFDLVILDLMMPVMDGLMFLHEVRDHRGLDLPILVLTATEDSREGRRQDLIQAGADQVAYKPIKAAELLELIAGR